MINSVIIIRSAIHNGINKTKDVMAGGESKMISYYDTWWTWDFIPLILFYLGSVYFYMLIKRMNPNDPELGKLSKVNGFLIGLGIAIASFFAVGLYCLIDVALYLATIGIWKLLEKKR